MGAWNSDPFGNDTAGDWKYDLEQSDDLSFIEETLQTVIDVKDGYLEAPEAEAAIAAADTLARLKGKFYMKDAYTESVDQWVEAHKIPPPKELIDLAIQAIDRILSEPSELLELWQDSEDFETWTMHIKSLKQRIQ